MCVCVCACVCLCNDARQFCLILHNIRICSQILRCGLHNSTYEWDSKCIAFERCTFVLKVVCNVRLSHLYTTARSLCVCVRGWVGGLF